MNKPARPEDRPSDDFDDEDVSRAAPPGSRARKWLLLLRRTRYKNVWLFTASLLETTIVPIPIEIVLIPYMAADRNRIWRIATVALLGCLLGAFIGYGVGYFVFETVGLQLIEWAGWSDSLDQFRRLFSRQGFWAILAVGILPIPFQVAMLAAGAAAYPLAWFTLAAVIARGLRYYGLAWLVKRFGPAALHYWRHHKLRASLIGGALLLALWGLVQWLGNLAGVAAGGTG